MNTEELIELLECRFYSDFAVQVSQVIIGANSVESLFCVANNNFSAIAPQTKANRAKVVFRAAYVLEYIYFNHHEHFEPYTKRFVELYPSCSNSSAHRHFTKMMAHLLQHHKLSLRHKESIANATAHWLCQKGTKVAVIVWAMAILKILRLEISWIDQQWSEIESIATSKDTPAIRVRKSKGW